MVKGLAGFLQKPFDYDQLMAVMRSARRRPDEAAARGRLRLDRFPVPYQALERSRPFHVAHEYDGVAH